MTRLTKGQILTHKEWLTLWREPASMKRYVEDVNDYMGSKDFFNQAGIQFLRDAWIASEFSILRGASSVRLVPDEWPDFELKTGDKIDRFEATEGDELGRRRGEEYRRKEALAEYDGSSIEEDPVENWVKRAEQVPEILRTVIQKKTGKRYGASTQLVVYLNISEYGIRQREIETSFSRICHEGRGSFDAIWILWKQKVYGPFS